MKGKNYLIIAAAILFAAFSAFYRVSRSAAQTERPRTTTGSATPTPIPSVAPTLKEEDQVVKVDTELVNINVRVVDRNNRPINNLQKEQFKVLEDGQSQDIEFFSKAEVPTNYSLVIDNSGSMRQQLEKVIEAGKILVNANKPDDETSIIRFVSSDKITVDQPFTASKPDLNDSLDNMYIEGGQTAIRDAIYLAVDQVQQYEKAEKDDRKRRAIILVSDGEDRDSYYTEPQLMDLLRESDVQIFVIGFVEDLDKEKGFISKSPQDKAKNFLERLANETGGKSYFPTSVGELPEIAKSISSELRTQYSIGYLPTNEKPDGTYRNIKVVVDDGPNKEKRIAITKAGRTAGAAPLPTTPQSGTKPKR